MVLLTVLAFNHEVFPIAILLWDFDQELPLSLPSDGSVVSPDSFSSITNEITAAIILLSLSSLTILLTTEYSHASSQVEALLSPILHPMLSQEPLWFLKA